MPWWWRGRRGGARVGALRRSHSAHAVADAPRVDAALDDFAKGPPTKSFGAHAGDAACADHERATSAGRVRGDHAVERLPDSKSWRSQRGLPKGRAPAAIDAVDADDDDDAESTSQRQSTSSAADDVVTLIVGGIRFTTCRAVLTKVEDSMLGRMFGRCDGMLQATGEGTVYIHRDGEMFGMILDFLGGDPPDAARMQKTVRALPGAVQEALVQELDYYGLFTAAFGAPPWTDDAAFRPGPRMQSGRYGCAAVNAGGRVIVLGGYPDGTALNTTTLLDLEDLEKMAFTPGPDLLKGREGCAAVQIDADRVLVVGGCDEDRYLDTTEILHLEALEFTPGPNLQIARNGCCAVLLDARRILVCGGGNGNFQLSSTEILDLDTMTFAPGPSMATDRLGCAAVALDEHRILVAGGYSGSGNLDTTEILDVRTMAFAPGPSMSSARAGCAAVAVDARHVLVIGGLDSSDKSSATTELLDLATMEFEAGPKMKTRRYAVAATRLDAAGKPSILVVGGYVGHTILPTTELLAA